MRAVLTFTLLAAIAIAVAWFVSDLPGAVSVQIGDVTLATSTSWALVLVAALFLALYALFRLVAFLFSLPRRRRRQREASNRRRGDESVTRTLVALAAGDSGAARHEAARGRTFLGDTPLTLLLAAQSARQAGLEGEATSLFQQLAAPSGRDRTNAQFLGLRGLLRQAITREDWAEASMLAERAEQVVPGAAWLREERAQLAVRTGQWRDAIRLGAGSAAVAVAAAEAEPNLKQATRLAQRAWETDPALTPAAIAYARRLRQSGKEFAAKDVLRRAWASNAHPDLAAFALHGVGSGGGDGGARLRAANDLVRLAPDSAESHLLLARTALDARMLPEAKRQAEFARERGMAQRRLYALLADIAQAENDPAAVRAANRDEAIAEPDPVWRCAQCGTVHPTWLATCPACGTTGQVAWGPAGGERAVRQLPKPTTADTIDAVI